MIQMGSSRGNQRFFQFISKCKVIIVLFIFFLFHAVPNVYAQENNVEKKAESASGNVVLADEENEKNTESAEEESRQENQKEGGEENKEEPNQNSGEENKQDNQEENREEEKKENEADASIYTDSQGIIYQLDLDGDTCYVSGYAKNIVSYVRIPSQVEVEGKTYSIKGIQKQAFSKCSKLKKLEISNSSKDILKGTFSNCKNLTSINIVPDKFSIKKSGKTCTASVRVNSVLLSEAGSAVMKFNKDVLKEAASKKGTDTVELAIYVTGSSDAAQYATLERMELDAEAASILSKNSKNLKVKVKDTEGKKYYVLVDEAGLRQIGGGLKLKLQETRTDRTTGNLKTDLKKAFQKNSISQKGAVIYRMSFGNGTKAGADIVLPVKDKGNIKAGSMIYVYRYEKSKRDFATVLYHPVTVNSQGNVKLPLDKDGIYVLSTKRFQYMCRKLSNKFITEAGRTYYIDNHGQIAYGWKKIGSYYYYLDRENGKMATSCTVDGVQLTKGGQAVSTNANIQKIQTMIKARNVVLQVTNPSDTLEQKIEKCFRWVFQFPYRQYRSVTPIYRQAGWEVTFANDIFDRHQGCCVSEAAATAFLFHECGCKTVYVATDTGHGWVELNGRVYDPLFAEARGFNNYYNRPYAGYGMIAVVKHKI